MKRIRHYIFNTLCLLSLAKFLCAGLLWPRTIYYGDYIHYWSHSDTMYSIGTRPNIITLSIIRKYSDQTSTDLFNEPSSFQAPTRGWSYTAHPWGKLWNWSPPLMSKFGFGWAGRDFQLTAPDDMYSGYQVFVPIWIVMLCCTVFPAIWVSGYRRRRFRARHNLCPSCGQKLGDAKDRCPKCGVALPPKAST